MTKHIVIHQIRDNIIRELARVYLSRAVTTRWIPSALAPARSSCRRCSSNTASTHHLTFAVTKLIITDVGTAGRYSKNNNLEKTKATGCKKIFWNLKIINFVINNELKESAN